MLDFWDMALNGTESTGTITSTVNAAGCVGAGHGCSNMELCAQCFVEDMQCAAASPSWGGNDDATADECDIAYMVATKNEEATRVYTDLFVDACAAKSKGGDFPSYRQCMADDLKRTEDACLKEMNTLKGFDAFEEVPEDSLPSWNPSWKRSWGPKTLELGQADEVTDCPWAMRYKRDDCGEVKELKARCSFDGAQRMRKREKCKRRMQGNGDSSAGSSADIETFSPTTRSTTFTLCSAKAKAEGKKHGSFDVSGAYLQGTPRESEIVYARPPPGWRTFDERGVPIVWRMKVPLYGQEDAGLIWYRTIIEQLVSQQKFVQSEADPCYLYKVYSNGERIDLILYVDDGYYFFSEGSSQAEREISALAERFKIKVVPEPKQFLGLNIDKPSGGAASEGGAFKMTMRAYLSKVADDCLSKPLADWPTLMTPCEPKLYEAFERAKAKAADGHVARAPS